MPRRPKPKPINATIYRFVAERCPPAELPGRWKAFSAEGVHAGHPQPRTLVAELVAKFARDELLASGVVVPGTPPDGLELIPELTSPAKPFLAIRSGPRTHDLVTAQGCLSGRRLPVTAACHDWHSVHSLQGRRTLFIAFSVEDMAVLRALNFAAATAAGLSQLGGERLDEFCDQLRLPRRGRRRVSGVGVMPILVAWQPAAWDLSEPPEWAATVAHLRRLHHVLGVDLQHATCWRPTADDLEELAFAFQFGSAADDVRAWVRESCRHRAVTGLITGAKLHVRVELREALLRFEQAPDASGRQKAMATVKHVLERDVIQPLRAEGLACDDPKVKNLHVLLADLSRLHHEQALKLRLGSARPATDEDRAAENKERQTLLSTTDRILRLTMELRNWRPKR